MTQSIVANSPVESHATPHDSLLARQTWAYKMAIDFELSGVELAVLVRVSYRAGTPRGCYESVNNLAIAIRHSRHPVQRALARLVGMGLLIKQENPGWPSSYYLGEVAQKCPGSVTQARTGLGTQASSGLGGVPEIAHKPGNNQESKPEHGLNDGTADHLGKDGPRQPPSPRHLCQRDSVDDPTEIDEIHRMFYDNLDLLMNTGTPWVNQTTALEFYELHGLHELLRQVGQKQRKRDR